MFPSATPSVVPSGFPTVSPTQSIQPSNGPTVAPTASPTRLLVGARTVGDVFASNSMEQIVKLQVGTGPSTPNGQTVVKFITVLYADGTAALHGWGDALQVRDIYLDPFEYITMVKIHFDSEYVRGIMFFTNLGNFHGTFGNAAYPFQMLRQPRSGTMLSGFHGRKSSQGIHALGFNWNVAPREAPLGHYADTLCSQDACPDDEVLVSDDSETSAGMTTQDVTALSTLIADAVGNMNSAIGEVYGSKKLKSLGYTIRGAGPTLGMAVLLLPNQKDDTVETLANLFVLVHAKLDEMMDRIEDGFKMLANEIKTALGYDRFKDIRLKLNVVETTWQNFVRSRGSVAEEMY